MHSLYVVVKQSVHIVSDMEYTKKISMKSHTKLQPNNGSGWKMSMKIETVVRPPLLMNMEKLCKRRLPARKRTTRRQIAYPIFDDVQQAMS